MPGVRNRDLRPFCLSHTFADLRYGEDVCTSPDYEIRFDPVKGWSLYLLKAVAGLLIPLGGVFTSNDALSTLRKKSLDRRRHIISNLAGDGNWNADPQLAPLKHCWPAAFANEATEGVNNEKYNCEFVYLIAESYHDMPKYEGISCKGEMIFLEVMVTPLRRTIPDGGLEAFVHYDAVEKREGKYGKMTNWGYTPKDFVWANLAPEFGRHWFIGLFHKRLVLFEQQCQINEYEENLKKEKEAERQRSLLKEIRTGKRTVIGALNHFNRGRKKKRTIGV